MIEWKRGCAAAACMLLACWEVKANDGVESIPLESSLNSIAEAATAPPLQLKLADRLSWTPSDHAWPPTSRKEFIAAIWPHAERAAKAIGVTPHALAAQ